jgi:hypothetical protein
MLSKKEPCVVHGLSVSLFFLELQKIRPPARKKLMEGNSGPDPLSLPPLLNNRLMTTKEEVDWSLLGGNKS